MNFTNKKADNFHVEWPVYKTSISKHRLGQPVHELVEDYPVQNLTYEGWDFTIPAGFKWDGADTVLFSNRLTIPALYPRLYLQRSWR